MPADSKTEKATPKKRRDERKEGNVFQSKDVVSVTFVFVSFYAIQLLFPFMYETIVDFTKEFLTFVGTTASLDNGLAEIYSLEFVIAFAWAVLPLALICVAVSIIMHGIQTKFLFSAKSLQPKLNRINPIEGIKKLFALRNFVELIKNLLKVIILIVIVYSLMGDYISQVMRTANMSTHAAVSFTFDMAMTIITTVTGVFAVIAFFDYLYQRWEYERKIRMSKQELKEEYKNTEGNPEIKGKIKQMQTQRARSRMMQAVPSADVIIKNPTHYAVAISYKPEKNAAPVVIAKGVEELALRIIKVGEENDVVVIENRELARSIHASTEINQEIPTELYGAVAEILVYVYKLKNNLR